MLDVLFLDLPTKKRKTKKLRVRNAKWDQLPAINKSKLWIPNLVLPPFSQFPRKYENVGGGKTIINNDRKKETDINRSDQYLALQKGSRIFLFGNFRNETWKIYNKLGRSSLKYAGAATVGNYRQ